MLMYFFSINKCLSSLESLHILEIKIYKGNLIVFHVIVCFQLGAYFTGTNFRGLISGRPMSLCFSIPLPEFTFLEDT